MRYAFGLGGLLITLGVIVWIMGGPGGELDQAKAALDAQKKVAPQINQWSGKAPDGTMAEDSASLQAQTDQAGKLRGLLVADVVPGGVYDTHYGLKQYDLIVQVGPLDIRTQDEGMGKAMMTEAFSRNQEIIVVRNNERITLPLPARTPSNSAAATPGVPTTPAGPPKSKGLAGQLDSIQNSIPTH